MVLSREMMIDYAQRSDSAVLVDVLKKRGYHAAIPATNPKDAYMAIRAANSLLKHPVLDQIAIYCSTAEQVRAAKAAWGLSDGEWVEDVVTGMASLDGEPEERSVARLLFNYDLGIEVEILQYLEGDNWHARWTKRHERIGKPNDAETKFSMPFISHIGFHVNDGPMPSLPLPLLQELKTQTHTNEYLRDNGRKYWYRIYDTRQFNGCFTKYIKRIA